MPVSCLGAAANAGSWTARLWFEQSIEADAGPFHYRQAIQDSLIVARSSAAYASEAPIQAAPAQFDRVADSHPGRVLDGSSPSANFSHPAGPLWEEREGYGNPGSYLSASI